MDESIVDLLKTKNTHKFYESMAWRRKRKEALKRDKYCCQQCRERGKFSRAQCVHHIKEITAFPMLALSLDNLKSLCHCCHDEIHERNQFGIPAHRKKLDLPERW